MGGGDQQYWDTVAAQWQQTAPQLTWRMHSDRVNAALLARWLPAARLGRLLKTDAFDEAAGAGVVAQLAARATMVIAIDISRIALAAAVRKYPDLAVAAADLRRIPVADETLDTVVSLSSLDHFESLDELAASLHELRRVLAPGGQLILTLDNARNPAVRLRNALPFSWLNRWGIVPYRVGKTVGPRQLQMLLMQAGLEVEEVDAILHTPRVLAVALAQVIDRLGSERLRRGCLALFLACEQLARLPMRFFTGYFVAVRARRPSGPVP